MPQHQPQVASTEGAGRQEELALLEGEELAAYYAGNFRPNEQGDDEHRALDGPIAKAGGEHDQDEQQRHREDGVGEAHHHVVDPAAEEAAKHADGDADRAGDSLRENADETRHAAADAETRD